MGRGSILGTNNIMNGDEWCYNAIACSDQSTVLLQIPKDLFLAQMDIEHKLKDGVDAQIQYLELFGYPQVDYLIFSDNKIKGEEKLRMLNYQKYILWTEGKEE